MKLYRVVVPGRAPYTLTASSITHAMNFVRHWASVRVVAIQPMSARQQSRAARYGLVH